ncbi:MAG: PPC domain-containing protein [Deltaproteobacteria bacterium]|nr:PPC domain-containing protein [Deltaproteobacteria bacterium]
MNGLENWQIDVPCVGIADKRRYAGKWIIHGLLAASLLFCACKETEKNGTLDSDSSSESACAWDTEEDVASAFVLAGATPVKGYICPTADEDWFTFSIPAGQSLVQVNLSLDAPVSPLNLVYYIWDSTGANVVGTLDSGKSVVAGTSLSSSFYLPSGTYHLQVRDDGADGQDVYHPYQLTVTTAADADVQEPNNDAPGATALTGGSATGYLSYDGDEDWYMVEGRENGIIQLHLTMPVSFVAPAFRIVTASGVELASGDNPAGMSVATDISYDLAVDSAEPIYVVVSGTDAGGSDVAVAYTLQVTVAPDPDSNENNDHPSVATPMTTIGCGAAWSDWSEVQGYIASSGDEDWYALNTGNCDHGVLQVELTFANAGSLPAGFRPTVSFVREYDGAACTVDQECQTLPENCDDDLGCSYLGNSCVKQGGSQGVCAGASVCLPSGNCGANWAVAQASEGAPGVVQFTAPLNNWSASGNIYLAVSDTVGELFSVNHIYTLRARLIADADGNEVSGAYSTRPPSDNDKVYNHIANAVPVPVHDCTQSGGVDTGSDTDSDTGGTADSDTTAVDTESDNSAAPTTVPGCCGPNDWVEGYISYLYDEDWYAYPHPCPGEDCMVRIHYQLGEGPVDTYLRLFADGNMWYDNLASIKEQSVQSAVTGFFGNTTAADCFYAYNKHGDFYYLSIRDTIFVSESQPLAGQWDWSVGQYYRFCVEKIANGCQSPCQYYEGSGCGQPSAD